MKKTGLELIATERQEQIEKHGKTTEKDVANNDYMQLSLGALMLLSVDYEEGIDSASYPKGWDEEMCTKMIGKSYEERLVIAGALLCAELDRLQAEK